MAAAINTRPTDLMLGFVGTFPKKPSRIAGDYHARWHVCRDQAAGANDCIFPNRNPPKQSRPRPNSRAVFNRGTLAIPVGVSFQRAVSCCRSWVPVIDEDNPVTKKNV